ncbi:MAG: Tungstate uptake system permease protein TupB [Alphaproteobacteria bacterium MarineAlpha3_Bin5]|nr:ABC transporter permease [Magnetovibrio sp.]PPR76836.1 MAG: Tungstate uptake system permease protein TupB [Alphaproteobacteria bacterium MarineAlpha3_Bin5]
MNEFSTAFIEALELLLNLDSDLLEIVALSLRVSLSALAISIIVAFPLGGFLGVFRFPGRGIIIIIFNALLGLPPVVVGLSVYLILSRSGPLGPLDLLFTPTAMIIAQFILVTPIVTALAIQTIEDLWVEYAEQLKSLGATKVDAILTLLWEGRYTLLTAVLAGFGRAVAEVGAVMIVGGNINHVTRTMTTAITLETSKGELALALGLGFILLFLSLSITALIHFSRNIMKQRLI